MKMIFVMENTAVPAVKDTPFGLSAKDPADGRIDQDCKVAKGCAAAAVIERSPKYLDTALG